MTFKTKRFADASAFNADMCGWSTAKVANMNAMFSGAIAFNVPIGSWNTARVSDMSFMFLDAVNLFQKLCWTPATNVLGILRNTACPSANCWGNGTWPGPCT